MTFQKHHNLFKKPARNVKTAQYYGKKELLKNHLRNALVKSIRSLRAYNLFDTEWGLKK